MLSCKKHLRGSGNDDEAPCPSPAMDIILMKAASMGLMILMGYLLKRLGVFGPDDANVVSRITINYTMPAALITSFRAFEFDPGFLFLTVLAVLTNLIMLGLGLGMTRGRDLPGRALYGLNLASYNVGTFVLPFVQSFLPPAGLVAASLFDTGNCPMNTGVSYSVVTSLSSGQRFRFGFVLERLRQSPPFMTYLIMTILSVLGVRLPDAVFQLTSVVGAAHTPLAMLMIGLLFELRLDREERTHTSRILLLRYGCNLVFTGLVWLLPIPLLLRQVAALCLLSPIPCITMVYSEQCGCKPSSCGVLNSVSILISLGLTFVLLVLWQL